MANTEGWQGTRVLVTGGAGFIGSHLVDGLLSRGAAVRVIDNLETGSKANLSHCLDRIDWHEADIRDRQACARVCEDIDLVFHEAALGSVPRSMKDPATSIEVNVSGTANIFAAARDAKVKRVVYASSSSVYGDDERLPKQEGHEGEPLSPYALSKRVNEQLATTYARCFGMSFVGLRYFNVYGPRQSDNGPYAAVIPKFFAACLSGNAPRIYGDGEQSRDFTYVADVVQANLLAGLSDVDGAIAVNVGAGKATSVNELAQVIRTLTAADVAIEHVDPRPGDVLHSLAATDRATAALGFGAVVPIAEGLGHTFEWRRGQA